MSTMDPSLLIDKLKSANARLRLSVTRQLDSSALFSEQSSRKGMIMENGFARSDGDHETWPASLSSNADRNPDDLRDHLNTSEKEWKATLGQMLMGSEQCSRKYRLKEFPLNYRLFPPLSRQKQFADQVMDSFEEENAPVLFGHPSGMSFASPGDFLPHLQWLYYSSEMLRHECKCALCPLLSSCKDSAPSSSRSRIDQKTADSSTYGINYKSIRDRKDDAMILGHLRVGEVAWVILSVNQSGTKAGLIESLPHMSSISSSASKTCHLWWPAIVIRRTRRGIKSQSHDVDSNPLYGKDLKCNMKSDLEKDSSSSDQFFYHIKYITFSDEHMVQAAHIMPWLAWDPCHQVEAAGLAADVFSQKLCEPINTRATLESRKLIPDGDLRLDPLYKSYLAAIRVANEMANILRPLDMYLIRPAEDKQSLPRPLAKSGDGKNLHADAICYFQGIWLGAELIWLRDKVRIKCPTIPNIHVNAELYEPLVALLDVKHIWINKDRKFRLSGSLWRCIKSNHEPSRQWTQKWRCISNGGGDKSCHVSLNCVLGRHYPTQILVTGSDLELEGTKKVPLKCMQDMQDQRASKLAPSGRDTAYADFVKPLIAGSKRQRQDSVCVS